MNQQSGSDSDSDEDEDTKKKQKPESKLFTKIGVPKHDEEAQIKKAFKAQADEIQESSDEDNFLIKKDKPVYSSDSEAEQSDRKMK